MADFSIKTNSLSRDKLSEDFHEVQNIHYGDILTRFDNILDLGQVTLPSIIDSKISNYSKILLKNGDVIFADAAEDSTVGKAIEIRNLRGRNVVSGLHTIVARPMIIFAPYYMGYYLNSSIYHNQILPLMQGTKVSSISKSNLQSTTVNYPLSIAEQTKIGTFFRQLDELLTLHQCKLILGGKMEKVQYFHDYYKNWIRIYKEGAVRPITLAKYKMTLQWLCRLAPKLELSQLDRIAYQGLLNAYALEHERQTTMDFHHQLKGAILDALDDGIIDKDPTRKAIIKGKIPATKRIKYLSQFELRSLLAELDLGKEISWDWFILLVAKTGLRFSEALALTPQDFDFSHQVITVDKTWDYKDGGGFLPTKNKSSARKVQIDWQLVIQFFELTKDLPEGKPIFVSGKVYNSTVNNCLFRRCRAAKIPEISIHSLRHTHASLLLFSGVSIASVARRLGHASMTTTQKTYLHIIRELENQDIDLIMRSLTSLT